MEVFIIAGVTVLFAFFFSGIYSFTQLWVTSISSLVLLRLIRNSASNAVNYQIDNSKFSKLAPSDSEDDVISIQKEMIEIAGISDSAPNATDKITNLVSGLEQNVTKGVTSGIAGVFNLKDSILTSTTDRLPNILSHDSNFNNINNNDNNNSESVNEKKKIEMPFIGNSLPLPIPDIRVGPLRSSFDKLKVGKKDKSKKEKELEFTFGNEQIEKKASDNSIIESDIPLKEKKDSFGLKKFRDQIKSSVSEAEDHLRGFNKEEKKEALQSSTENIVVDKKEEKKEKKDGEKKDGFGLKKFRDQIKSNISEAEDHIRGSFSKEEKKEELQSSSEKHPIDDTKEVEKKEEEKEKKEEKKEKKDGEKKDGFGLKKFRDQIKSNISEAEDHLRGSFSKEEKEDLRSSSEKPTVDKKQKRNSKEEEKKEEKKDKRDGEKKAIGEGLMGKFGIKIDRKSKSPRKDDKSNLLSNTEQLPLSKSQEIIVNQSENVDDKISDNIIKEAQENPQPESTRRNTFISSQRIPEVQPENITNENNIVSETSSNILIDNNNSKNNSLEHIEVPKEKKEKFGSLGHGFIKDGFKKMIHIGQEDEKGKKEKEEEKERRKEKEKEEAERQKRHKEEMEFLEKREELEKKKEKEEKKRIKEKERLEKEEEEKKKAKEEADLQKRHKEEMEFLEKRDKERKKEEEKEAKKNEGDHHGIGPGFLFDGIKKIANGDEKKKKEGGDPEADEVKLRKEPKKKEKKERRKSHRKSLDIPKNEDGSGTLKVSRSVMANLDSDDQKSESLEDAEEKLSHDEKANYLSKKFIKGSFKKLVHHEKKDGEEKEEKSPKKLKNLLKKSRSITQIANSDSSTDLSGELLTKEEKATTLQKEFFKESMKEFIPSPDDTHDQQSTPDKKSEKKHEKKEKKEKREDKKEEKKEVTKEEKEKVDKKSSKIKNKFGRVKNLLT